jgi:hypothetical protein
MNLLSSECGNQQGFGGSVRKVQALMFVTPPLQGGVLKRPVAYAVTEFCLAESKAV